MKKCSTFKNLFSSFRILSLILLVGSNSLKPLNCIAQKKTVVSLKPVENIIYPSEATAIIDITKPSYNADKTGKKDCTEIQLFFDAQNNQYYEGPYSRPHFNKFYGIETLLPYGAIAQLYPQHPLLPTVGEYCASKADANGLVSDKHVTTEGCYTIAYPLAAIAVALNQKQLARLAIQQLLFRKNLLVKNNTIHQKMDEKQQLSYANWARGVSWYLLGMVRTLSIVDENKIFFQDFEKDIEIIKTELGRDGNRTLASLYDLMASKKIPGSQKKIGEWNHGIIRAFPDDNVEYWLNGYQVLQYQRGSKQFLDLVAISKYKDWPNFGMAAKGRILLQDHGDQVFFKSIKIRQLLNQK